MSSAYPLQWPAGWPRTDPMRREASRFKVTVPQALDGLANEIRLLGARNLIVSSNCTLGDMRPKDPGVCAFFEYQGMRAGIPCDRWNKVEDNVHAIAKTIEAMRGIDRWGAKHMLKAAFTGFAALSGPSSARDWRTVLGLTNTAPSLEQARQQYRLLSSQHHPDKPGGSHERQQELNVAWEEAQKALGR